MPISDQHREQIFRTLTIMRQGFLELGEVDGTPCVPMLQKGHLVLPEGTRSLFLRLWIPARALEPGPARLAILDEEGNALSHIEMDTEELWASISTRGNTRIRIEAERPWPGALIGLPQETKVGVLIRDAEILASDLRPQFDLEASDGRGHRFLTLRLDLTNKCNLRCRMCGLSFDEIFHQKKNYVDVGDFKRIARQFLPRAEQLSLSAGYEPLLNPEFTEVLSVVRSHDVPFVEFTTNGTLLDEKLMHAFVDHEVSRVTFSVDGARADTYEHIRRGADFARFKEALEIFGRVRKERGVSKPELSFNMVLMRRNIDELVEVIRLGAANGLDVMHSCLLIPHVGLEMEDEALQNDRARANRALAAAREAARELGIRASFPDDFNLDLPEEPFEALPSTPEYTLAEDWGTERPRGYTLTRGDQVGDLDFERGATEALPCPAPVPDPKVVAAPAKHPGSPTWRTIAEIPNSEALERPLQPRSYGPLGKATIIKSGHATTQEQAQDGDGTPITTACIYPWNLAIINPELQIVPCCNWRDYSTMGDLKSRSFDEIWNGDEYQQLRLELQTGRYRPCCEHCPERREI